MKVMLIYPPGTVYGSGMLTSNIPMGMLYLVSYLKKKGIEVKFLDALAADSQRMIRVGDGRRYGMSEKKIAFEIRKFNPDMVGIGTMFTAYFNDSLETAKIVKKVNKKIIVILGGSHVSIDPIKVVKNKAVDVAVYGEGEETIYELAVGKDLKKIKGIVYKDGKKIIKNEQRELIKNLDDIPFPAWDNLDLGKYGLGGNFNMRKPVFPLVSSRGCPGRCLYCSVNSVWRHKWRGRSAKNVVDEMEFLINKYGAREFAFQDDSLSIDKTRLKNICNEIIKRKINIKWTTPNGIAHWTLNKDLLLLMKKAGCYRITFGIESGDEELRRWVGKPYSLSQAKELTEYANKIGYWTLATNIIGFPYEDMEDINNTYKFALNSDVDLAFFFRLGPRIGTPIYEIFLKEGWLMKDRHLLFSEDVACQTKYFSGEQIVEIQKKLYKGFLFKRWLTPMSLIRIGRKIKSWEDFVYICRIAFIGLKLSRNLLSTKKRVTSKTLSV